jgi:hypothetical protein
VRQRAFLNRAKPKPDRANKPLQETILLVVNNEAQS